MRSEADHTAPSEWCPHPQRWHAPDGWATEDEVTELVAALVRATQPELVVETGSYLGHTAAAIGAALHRNGHGRLDTLEVDPDRAARTMEACFGLPVRVLCQDSLTYTPPEPVGLAWLDSADIRADELARLRPHLAPGAIVAVHDTAPHTHGADRLAELTGGAPAINLRTPRGVLIFQPT